MISESRGTSDVAVSSADKIANARVGDRIECSGQYGTIKYIGAVEGYSGTWLGIDWDNPERGKHNGCVSGKQYFTASCPTSGSFVRPEKVHYGQSAVESITSRYGNKEDDFAARIHQQQLLKMQHEIKAPFLQLVGFDEIIDKQSDFNNLKVVSLRLQRINTPGGPLELKQLCPNIVELDISKNLLTTWSSIFDICEQLTSLEWLNVSENYLVMPEEYKKYCYPSLKTLICGVMKLNWQDIIKLSYVFPNIEELRAITNNIRCLDTPAENNFKNLQLLDIENNDIKEWSEICKLSVIPTLQHLVLDNIRLTSIRFKKCENQRLDFFTNINRLAISNNLINDWKSIGELNKLANLEDLRFLKNPILETENYATCCQIIIARLAKLKMLNATEISYADRGGAEYDYLKKYGLEWLAVKDTEKREEFLEDHNRYLELIKEYGTIEEDLLKVQSNTINSLLVSVEIQHDGKSVIKKLPRSIIIQKLIMLVQKLFKLSERPRLKYISGMQPDVEIELDDECKELSFYSVQDGDQLIVIL